MEYKRAQEIMKKILFLFLTMCTLIVSANSQVCKISGENDNVEIFSCLLAENNTEVHVVVANDSQSISANVTVTVEVDYGGNIKKTYTGRAIAKPNQETLIIIKGVSPKVSNRDVKSVQAISITGAKCL